MTPSRRLPRLAFRDVLAVAVPMTLGYLSTPFVGLVALAVVGAGGDAAPVGGVALGGVVCDLVFGAFYFLRAGTTGFTAQAYGRGDGVELRAVLMRGLVVALAGGLLVALLARPMVAVAADLLGADAAVAPSLRTYAEIRLWAAPATLVDFVVFGWLLGHGRAVAGLVLQTLLNGTAVALALAFVIGLDWGPAGAAWAAVVAEVVALVAGLALVVREGRGAVWPPVSAWFDGAAFRARGAADFHLMIRTAVLIAAFSLFARWSAVQGEIVLAANALLEKFFLVAAYFLDGFAAAAETFVGRAVGARDRDAFDRAFALALAGGGGLAVVAALALLVGGGALLDLVAGSPEVRGFAGAFLPWAALTPLAGVFAFHMDGVFIGATWTRDMALAMVASLVGFVLLHALLAPPFGNHGLWAAFVAFLAMRGFGLAVFLPARARTIGADPT